jgi:hypothetical protein
MISVKPVPPPPHYKKAQEELHKLEEQDLEPYRADQKVAHYGKIRSYYGQLFRIFKSTFILRETEDPRLYEMKQELHDLDGRLIDHVTLFKHRSVGIIVTQPYHQFDSEDLETLNTAGYAVVDLNDWAFYYPGRAFCYAILGDLRVRRPQPVNQLENVGAVIFA